MNLFKSYYFLVLSFCAGIASCKKEPCRVYDPVGKWSVTEELRVWNYNHETVSYRSKKFRMELYADGSAIYNGNDPAVYDTSHWIIDTTNRKVYFTTSEIPCDTIGSFQPTPEIQHSGIEVVRLELEDYTQNYQRWLIHVPLPQNSGSDFTWTLRRE